jgi:hypothetical protein
MHAGLAMLALPNPDTYCPSFDAKHLLAALCYAFVSPALREARRLSFPPTAPSYVSRRGAS